MLDNPISRTLPLPVTDAIPNRARGLDRLSRFTGIDGGSSDATRRSARRRRTRIFDV